jgi:hypothetical protein
MHQRSKDMSFTADKHDLVLGLQLDIPGLCYSLFAPMGKIILFSFTLPR